MMLADRINRFEKLVNEGFAKLRSDLNKQVRRTPRITNIGKIRVYLQGLDVGVYVSTKEMCEKFGFKMSSISSEISKLWKKGELVRVGTTGKEFLYADKKINV